MRCRTEQITIGKLNVLRGNINDSPDYQREGGLWNKEKQSLFIDSIFSEYDIPKIYLHDLRVNDDRIQYAVIDGKQRLHAIYDFMDSKFSATLENKSNREILFSELSEKEKEFFKSVSLDIVLVENVDENDIEDLFYRLNNGMTLSTAEKRNAIGGDMCEVIRRVSAKNKFFTDRMKIKNTRKVHLEIATKFLLIEHLSMLNPSSKDIIKDIDLTKKPLDSFVLQNKKLSDNQQKKLIKRTEQKLRAPENIFKSKDYFLTKHVFIQTYYILIRNLLLQYSVENEKIRFFLEEFEQKRLQDREKDESERDVDFVSFALQVQQGIGNKGAIAARDEILRKYYLKWHPETLPKDPNRAFNDEERYLIWSEAGKKCKNCEKDIEFHSMEADHILPHSKGGKTSVENGQSLCKDCHKKKTKETR